MARKLTACLLLPLLLVIAIPGRAALNPLKPVDYEDCRSKHLPGTSLPEARRVVTLSCRWAFGERQPASRQRIAQCLLSRPESFGSVGEAQSLIRTCSVSHNSIDAFYELSRQLRHDAFAAEEPSDGPGGRQAPKAGSRPLEFNLIDPKTGEIKLCRLAGHALDCI